MRVLLPLACALLMPASAAASAGWRQLPSYPIPGGGPAACLRGAGDDRLAVAVDHAESPGIDLLTVGAAGPRRSAAVRLGPLIGCATVSAVPGRAPLLAAPVLGSRDTGWVAGSPGRAPQQLALRDAPVFATAAVATAADGAAAVVWVDSARSRGGDSDVLLRVARRTSPGTPLGRAVTVARGLAVDQRVAAAFDRSGRLTVAWAASADGGRSTRVGVAQAAPGAPLQTVATFARADFVASLSLAVADGRALLGVAGSHTAQAWEQRPGSTRFAPVRGLPARGSEIAVALDDEGAGAAVAVDRGRDVAIARRAGDGAFAPAERVARVPARRSRTDDGGSVEGIFSPAPLDEEGTPLAVALHGGRFVVSWVDPALGVRAGTAYGVAGTLADGLVVSDRLGSPCRGAGAATPLRLADGTLALAWSDDAKTTTSVEELLQRSGGRVAVALPAAWADPAASADPAAGGSAGAAGAGSFAGAPAAPRVRARLLGDGAIGPGEPLRLLLHCLDGPCDVRASAWAALVRGSDAPRRRTVPTVAGAVATTLRRGARTVVRLPALPRHAFVAPGRTAHPRIAIAACAPDGGATRRTLLTPRLRGRPLPPAPRIEGLTARAVRGGVRVSWRLAAPLRERGRSTITAGHSTSIADVPAGRTRFSAVVAVAPPPAAVTLSIATAAVQDAALRTVAVR